ncbi:MAG: cyclopropane-fatty-acyl-phospholipid synthase family protein [Rhizomicrobium sp.]|jgi:cyclopropane-fatty-acyl-phospholipid synthase
MLGLFLSRLIRQGTLTVIDSKGRRRTYGAGSPRASLRLADSRVVWDMMWNPELRLGELFMDGRIVPEQCSIVDVLDVLMLNLEQARHHIALIETGRALRRLLRPLRQRNHAASAKANVHHHYDLSGQLYDLFLDQDKQYSCAYFSAPGETLEEAQVGKKRHIAAKLNLDREDLDVLDIGSGWGGLALDLARDCGARVLGCTLSDEQLKVARARSNKAGLSERAKFGLIDYRALDGQFDRIVSVGMFEHVGVPQYPEFFAKTRDLLKDDGVMVLHFIGRSDGPGSTNPWIRKYIFPGGYTPALSEVLPVIENSRLIVSDIEVLRLHYAETLKEWRKRFVARHDEVVKLYDERFFRMWEFYLAGSEMGFRRDGLVVYQIQVIKQIDALPMTRDYMVDDERRIKFAGTDHMPHQIRAA